MSVRGKRPESWRGFINLCSLHIIESFPKITERSWCACGVRKSYRYEGYCVEGFDAVYNSSRHHL